jgi:hypothetical protein
MKIELNIVKKHLYISAAVIALLAFVVFAAANSRNPGHNYDQIDLGPLYIGNLDDMPTDLNDGKVVVVNGDFQVTGKVALGTAFTEITCDVMGDDEGEDAGDTAECSCPSGTRFVSGGYICSTGSEEQANLAYFDGTNFVVDCNGDAEKKHFVDDIYLVCAYTII